ncbi:MAG: SAM-dependent methyltransferase [Rhodobacteraceae bacterium]|nr:MAG: SAM-dependent methyltransferase [Paracoccaceae bacterium]
MGQILFINQARRLIRTGTPEIRLPNGQQLTFGDGSEPSVSIHIKDSAVFAAILRNPELALGEAYMDGRLEVAGDDLRGLLILAIRNADAGNLPPIQKLAGRARVALRLWAQRSPIAVARRNVEHHYEFPAAFYDLFMEEDKQYTCAYFQSPEDTLEQAQANKKAHIAKKLLLRPGMRVMDIGSGWGGLAITLARDYGVHVTGVTLSNEQLGVARERAVAAGVADRVDFRLVDYRHVDEQFDRIVAVGMLEHVGQPQYGTYFRKISANLKDNGVALIHFIGRSGPPGATSPWIQKYIFPGGYIPALSEVMGAVEPTDLIATDIEVWRGHYERTIQHWEQRFEGNADKVRAMFDDRFVRMWRYYLAAAGVSFSDRFQVLYQLQLSKQLLTVPSTRDYLYQHPAQMPAPQRSKILESNDV